MVCKLCGKSHDDKVGSHLITESVIRSAASEEGSKGRDKELLATISPNQLGKKFVGRSASLTGIKSFVGRELTDEDLIQNDNPLVDFNLVCSICEKSFNVIETTFIQEVLPGIDIVPKDGYLELNHHAYKITSLFLVLNIWRLAATDKNPIQIPDTLLEEFRVLIDRFKHETYSSIINNLGLKVEFVMFFVEDSEAGPSANSILIDFMKTPKLLLMNNLMFLWFPNFSKDFRIPSILSGLTSKVKINKLIKLTEQSLPISYIIGKKSRHLRTNIFDKQLKEYNEYFSKIFKLNFKRIFGVKAPKYLINQFKSRIFQYFVKYQELGSESIIAEMKYILRKAYHYNQRHGQFY